jgi:hypothetical protein
MICGFCGREISADLPEKSCGRCAGGCHKVHCPYCGYENPAPSVFLERVLGRRKELKKED